MLTFSNDTRIKRSFIESLEKYLNRNKNISEGEVPLFIYDSLGKEVVISALVDLEENTGIDESFSSLCLSVITKLSKKDKIKSTLKLVERISVTNDTSYYKTLILYINTLRLLKIRNMTNGRCLILLDSIITSILTNTGTKNKSIFLKELREISYRLPINHKGVVICRIAMAFASIKDTSITSVLFNEFLYSREVLKEQEKDKEPGDRSMREIREEVYGIDYELIINGLQKNGEQLNKELKFMSKILKKTIKKG